MGFMDAYKRLEKLCRDSLNDDRGVSAYLELMEKTPRGAAKVENWEADYKQLKHYRWMRNKIAHDPGSTEENMCKAADLKWLKDFHKRIMEQTDPLALYRKVTVRKKPTPKPKPQQPYVENRTVAQYAAAPEKKNGCIWFLIAGALAIAALVLAQIFLK
jgi:hypothetical protein